MCFAPQRRALFRHRDFQKWSDAAVFCTFWLGNVLRATMACTFSTSELPKVVREWCVLYILTCKCASRHNGVHFFISHLASWLRTRRFSEPTFRPSGAPNHWKNTVFRDFPTFSRICIFFLLTLSLLIFSLLIFLFSLPLPCSAFHLSILSEVWLLNFLRPYIPYIWNVINTPTIHTIANIHAIHTIPTLHRKYSIPIIVIIHTIQTTHTVISNIPYPTDLHTIPTIHTIPTTHAMHTIPTIHTKHTILSKHAIPDRPYTPYIPNIHQHTIPHPHHTTGGEGDSATPPPHHRGGGGWDPSHGGGGRAWCIYICSDICVCIYIYML